MDYGGDFSTVGQALVRMINGLFGTEYQDEEKIWKEWRDQEALSVCLKVGGMNRYEFSAAEAGWMPSDLCRKQRKYICI